MVKLRNQEERAAAEAISRVLKSVTGEDVVVKSVPMVGSAKHDFVLETKSGGKKILLLVEARSRITPQTAFAVCRQVQEYATVHVPVIYAPVISPRVAEIARQQNVGYLDQAGNCWLRSPRGNLLIERIGFLGKRKAPKSAVDLFAPKSSRIVRVMLSHPATGWQVSKLAKHPDVQVSVGLAANVKQALIEEGYAIIHNRLLYLRDPQQLLEAWTMKYSGPAEQFSFYTRGDPDAAEKGVRQWCQQHGLTHTLAGYSAAWQIAPEVRYGIATFYVEDFGLQTKMTESLAEAGIKMVDSGANVHLWLPFDQSVFAGSSQGTAPSVTSPIQTYLDLRRVAGRGEDAAKAIFEKYLRDDFTAAAKNAEDLKRGNGPTKR